MKPIPSGASPIRLPPSAPASPLASIPGPPTKPNRRINPPARLNPYPWLLLASTLLAAVFCLLYITKPVIIEQTVAPSAPSAAAPSQPALSAPPAEKPLAATSGLLPAANSLPGEKPHSSATHTRHPPVIDQFEQTNLRIQHILTAKAPGNHIHRIDLEVPVLYQSRNLRWTAQQAEQARLLLGKLTDYQEKSRQLRNEGSALLQAWNHLIDSSLPMAELRADSPSLPSNQNGPENSIHSAEPSPVQLDIR